MENFLGIKCVYKKWILVLKYIFTVQFLSFLKSLSLNLIYLGVVFIYVLDEGVIYLVNEDYLFFMRIFLRLQSRVIFVC